jgi:hypothetical protein
MPRRARLRAPLPLSNSHAPALDILLPGAERAPIDPVGSRLLTDTQVPALHRAHAPERLALVLDLPSDCQLPSPCCDPASIPPLPKYPAVADGSLSNAMQIGEVLPMLVMSLSAFKKPVSWKI